MFKYNDKVKVTNGFFEGCSGVCISTTETLSVTGKKIWIIVHLSKDKSGVYMPTRIESFLEHELEKQFNSEKTC